MWIYNLNRARRARMRQSICIQWFFLIVAKCCFAMFRSKKSMEIGGVSMWLFKKKKDEELEKAFWELQMNLENNYKDLAISAHKKVIELMEDRKRSQSLSSKDYEK